MYDLRLEPIIFVVQTKPTYFNNLPSCAIMYNPFKKIATRYWDTLKVKVSNRQGTKVTL